MNKLQALLIAGLLSLSSVSFASYIGAGTSAGSLNTIFVENNTPILNVTNQFDASKELIYDIKMAAGYDGLATAFGSSTFAPDQFNASVSLYEAGSLVAGGLGIYSFTFMLTAGTDYIVKLTEVLGTDLSSGSLTVSSVPIPAAGILFASALFGAGAFGRRKKKAKASVVGAFARAS